MHAVRMLGTELRWVPSVAYSARIPITKWSFEMLHLRPGCTILPLPAAEPRKLYESFIFSRDDASGERSR